MVDITFEPEGLKFAAAAKAYAEIWKAEATRIVSAIEDLTGLPFQESNIGAVVFEGNSQSNPVMKLRASYDAGTKKATLAHELLHRLSVEYMLDLPVKGDGLALGLHRQIDLVLYDLWVRLYGTTFADEQVAVESTRTPMYKEAWDWALALSPLERRARFAELRERCLSRNN